MKQDECLTMMDNFTAANLRETDLQKSRGYSNDPNNSLITKWPLTGPPQNKTHNSGLIKNDNSLAVKYKGYIIHPY